MKFLEKNRLIILGALFFGLVIPLAFILNIWPDEAYTLNTTSGGPAYAFRQALHFELQAPIYFVLLSFWRVFSDSILWTRLFSVFSMFASLLIFDRLLKDRITHRFFPLLFMTVHPITVWAALEIRVYAFSIMTVALYLYFLIYHYHKNPEGWRNHLIHIGLIILGIFSYYYFGFILAGVFVWLLLFERKLLKSYILDLIIPALLLISMVGLIYFQIDSHTQFVVFEELSFINLLKYWLFEFFDYFLLPVHFIGHNPAFNIVFRLVVLAVLSWFLFGNKKNLSLFFKSIWFWLVLVFVIFLSIIKYSLGSVYAADPHTTLVLFPFLFLLVTIAGFAKKTKLANALFLILTFVASMGVFTTYKKQPYKDFDAKGLARYLNSMPYDQSAFVYTSATCLVLNYYVKGDRQLFPLPEEIRFDKYDYIKSIKICPSSLDTAVKGYLADNNVSNFFYISDNKRFGVDLTQEEHNLIKNYFIKHFSVIDSLDVAGFSVYRISKP